MGLGTALRRFQVLIFDRPNAIYNMASSNPLCCVMLDVIAEPESQRYVHCIFFHATRVPRHVCTHSVKCHSLMFTSNVFSPRSLHERAKDVVFSWMVRVGSFRSRRHASRGAVLVSQVNLATNDFIAFTDSHPLGEEINNPRGTPPARHVVPLSLSPITLTLASHSSPPRPQIVH